MALSFLSIVVVLVFIVGCGKLLSLRFKSGMGAATVSAVYMVISIGIAAAIYSLLNIPVTLGTVIAALALLDIGFLFANWKMKAWSVKLHFEIVELLAYGIVIIFMLALAIWHFGRNLELIYIDIDSARYLNTAMEFYRTKGISGEFLSPLLISLAMQWVSPFVDAAHLFRGMILYHIAMQVISTCMFLTLLNKLYTARKGWWIKALITMLYVCGYQLYVLTYGTFFHQQDGVLLIMFLIFHFLETESHEENTFVGIASVLLGICGLAICYPFYLIIASCLFLPEILLWVIKHWSGMKRRQKIALLAAALVAAIIGRIFILQRANSISGFLENLATDGVSYREPFLDFVFFVPFFVIYSVLMRKKKYRTEVHALWRMCTSGLIFILVWFWIFTKGYMSGYYYYRCYYVLWLLAWLMTAHTIRLLKEERQTLFLAGYACLYGIAIATSVFGANAYFSEIDEEMFLEDKDNQTLCPLYAFTSDKLFNRAEAAVSEPILELYDYILEEIPDDNVYMLTSYYTIMRATWFSSITSVNKTYTSCDIRSANVYDVLDYLDNNNADCVLLQKSDKTWMPYFKKVLSNAAILVENDEGYILGKSSERWVDLLDVYADSGDARIELFTYMREHFEPRTLRLLCEKKYSGLNKTAYRAYGGENTNAYLGVITPKKLMKSLATLDEDGVDSIVVFWNSKMYTQNKEFFDSLDIAYENDAGFIAGQGNRTWVEIGEALQ